MYLESKQAVKIDIPQNITKCKVKRVDPFGEAMFVAYVNNDPNNVIGAGSCPALSAHPNYCSFIINQNDYPSFILQSVSGELEYNLV
jgi:hypothetical protein